MKYCTDASTSFTRNGSRERAYNALSLLCTIPQQHSAGPQASMRSSDECNCTTAAHLAAGCRQALQRSRARAAQTPQLSEVLSTAESTIHRSGEMSRAR